MGGSNGGSELQQVQILDEFEYQAGHYNCHVHMAFKLTMTLNGSQLDMVRSPNISGPSPVGGSNGGSELQQVQILDEFEYQAGHYNCHVHMQHLGM